MGETLPEAEAFSSLIFESRHSRTDKLVPIEARAQDDFREIFERYARPLFGFLIDLVVDPALAEEMAQETFIRAYRTRAAKRPDTRISTWLFGIALNVAREAIRQKYRRKNTGVLDESVCRTLRDEKKSPDQNLLDLEARQAIQAALARLSESQRVVFLLKVVNQMRYQEIAAITGAGIGKLKTDLHRARLEMRKRLEPYFRRQASGM